MLIIIIKKPSGEDERIELAPGDELPPVEVGDRIEVQNPEGARIEVQVQNGDLILVVQSDPDGDGSASGETEMLVLKGMADALAKEGISLSLDLPGRESPLEIRSLEQIREIGLDGLEIPDFAEEPSEELAPIEEPSLEPVAEEAEIDVASGPTEEVLPAPEDSIESLPEAQPENLPVPEVETGPELAPPAPPVSVGGTGPFGDSFSGQDGFTRSTPESLFVDISPLAPTSEPARAVTVPRDNTSGNTPITEAETDPPSTPVYPDIIIDLSRSAAFDGETDSNGSRYFSSLEEGIRAAENGHDIYLENGTYQLSSTLILDKQLSVTGASEEGVVLDASAHNGYGVEISANDVSLSRITLTGANHYGIKVQPDSLDSTDNVTGTSLSELTVSGGTRTGIDLNGADQASLSDISVTGSSSGVGIAMTDSSDVSLNGISTSGNAWGGIAIYTAGRYYEGGSDGIRFSGQISTSESAGIYQQTSGNNFDVTNLSLPAGCDYKLTNADFRSNGDEFTFFFADLADALVFGEMLTSPDSSILSYTNPNTGTVTSYSFETGTSGSDTLSASLGSALFGGDGADSLTGSSSDDILIGGKGNDILTGGEGADRFILSATDTGTDTILDFERSDLLDLSDLVDNGTTDFLFRDDGAGNAQISRQDDPDSLLLTLNNVGADSLQIDSEGIVTLAS